MYVDIFSTNNQYDLIVADPPCRQSKGGKKSFEIINRLYPDLRKIELYARTEREGYDCWENAVV